jgi:hypothetical protein
MTLLSLSRSALATARMSMGRDCIIRGLRQSSLLLCEVGSTDSRQHITTKDTSERYLWTDVFARHFQLTLQRGF